MFNEHYEDLPPLNKKIYSFINERNYSIRKFALEIGVAPQSVQRLFHIDKESNKYPVPSTNIRNAMIKRFNLSHNWFLIDDITFDMSKSRIGEDNEARRCRLNLVKEYLKLRGEITSISDIAKKMSKVSSSVLMMFCGKTTITDTFLYSLNEAFNNMFDMTWLINGQGKMLSGRASTDNKEHDKDKTEDIILENERLKAMLHEASMEIIKLNSEIRQLKEQK